MFFGIKASARKTFTFTLTGIAGQEGFINTNNKVSDYIGPEWTSETLVKKTLSLAKTYSP